MNKVIKQVLSMTLTVMMICSLCSTAFAANNISLAGSTYEDAELSKTSTYGKLTFKHVWIGGLGASTCWLKGTVTGENDEIEVTWRM